MSGQLVMRGMSQLRPTFTQLLLSVILSGVRSRRLSAVYPTIDLASLISKQRKRERERERERQREIQKHEYQESIL